MNLFLDSSVNIAAAGSAVGASRLLFEVADENGWRLLTSRFVLHEADCNIPRLGAEAFDSWSALRSKLLVVPDVLAIPWPTILVPAKDRPILFTAASWGDVLLTLDRSDFVSLIGDRFYSMPISTPGAFIRAWRQR